MNRVLIICLCVLAFMGCKKSDEGVNQVKEQGRIDSSLIVDYIKNHNLNATRIMVGRADTTDIWYVITTVGTDNVLITQSSSVIVGYTGRLLSTGAVFAQTNTYHPSYNFGNMISGWRLGLTRSGIKKGGTVRLLMASRYAYGPYPQPTLGLPANAVLDFDIELFDVTN